MDGRRVADVDPVETVVPGIEEGAFADAAAHVAKRLQIGGCARRRAPSPLVPRIVTRARREVVHVYHRTGGDVALGSADEFAILAHAQSPGERAHGELVSRWNGLPQHHLAGHRATGDLDLQPRRELGEGGRNVVMRAQQPGLRLSVCGQEGGFGWDPDIAIMPALQGVEGTGASAAMSLSCWSSFQKSVGMRGDSAKVGGRFLGIAHPGDYAGDDGVRERKLRAAAASATACRARPPRCAACARRSPARPPGRRRWRPAWRPWQGCPN